MSEKSARNVLASPEKVAIATKEPVVASPAPASASENFFKFNTATVERVTTKELLKFGGTSKGGGKKSTLSLNICCAEGNRKSLKLSKSLYECLFGEINKNSDPRALQLVRDGKNLIIGEDLPGVSDSFDFSNPTSLTIYGSLVLWIVDKFNLDFSNGRTSRSFQHIEVVTPADGGTQKPYAVINMTRPLKR
jgi:hypothetical protein